MFVVLVFKLREPQHRMRHLPRCNVHVFSNSEPREPLSWPMYCFCCLSVRVLICFILLCFHVCVCLFIFLCLNLFSCLCFLLYFSVFCLFSGDLSLFVFLLGLSFSFYVCSLWSCSVFLEFWSLPEFLLVFWFREPQNGSGISHCASCTNVHRNPSPGNPCRGRCCCFCFLFVFSYLCVLFVFVCVCVSFLSLPVSLFIVSVAFVFCVDRLFVVCLLCVCFRVCFCVFCSFCCFSF